MKGKIFSDYNRINVNSKRGRSAFMGAIQHHWNMSLDASEKLLKAGIREFTSSVNFPDDVLSIIDRYHIDMAELDTAYEAAFDVLDLTSVKTSSFTVRSSSSGLTFGRVRDGQKAKVYAISGGEVTVGLNLYGGGLSWLKTWFDDGEWWTIEDNALEFRRKWYEEKAVLFYDMIQSLTNTAVFNTAYHTDAAMNQLELDRTTIGLAATALVNGLRDSGFGVTAGSPMIMFCPIAMKSRVEQCLNPSRFQVNDYRGGVSVNFNITPYYTSYLDWVEPGSTIATGGANWAGDATEALPLGYLAIPGRKNKIGNRMNLTLMGETDILSFAETVVGWGRYGAYLHEPQWQRVSSIA